MRYKFRYFNGTFKMINALFIPVQNLLIPWVFAWAIIRLLALIGLEQYLNNDLVINILQKAVLICAVFWALVYCFFRKGVILYDDRLVIARYTITLNNWKNRISVKYDDIESVNVNYKNLRFTRYYRAFLVPFGDEDYNVELTLKNGKKYFFSIEDQEDFCEALNLLLEKRSSQSREV